MAKIRRQKKWQRASPKWLSSHLLKLYPFSSVSCEKAWLCIHSFLHSFIHVKRRLGCSLEDCCCPCGRCCWCCDLPQFLGRWGRRGGVGVVFSASFKDLFSSSSSSSSSAFAEPLGYRQFWTFFFPPSCWNRTVVFFFFFFVLQDLFHRVMVLFFSVSFLLLFFCSFVSWDVFSLRFLPDSSPFVVKHHVFCCRVFSGDRKAGSRGRKRRIRANWSRVVTCCLLACRGVRLSVWWFFIRSFWSQSRSRVWNLMKLLGLSRLSSCSVAQNG